MSERKYYEIKIALVGEKQVGKTSILLRYTDDTYSEYWPSTINIDYKIRNVEVEGNSVKLFIYDQYSGSPRPIRTQTNHDTNPLKSAHTVVIIYDVSNENSFNQIESWLMHANRDAPDAIKVIVGNKSDSSDRIISYDKGKSFAIDEKHLNLFFEVSAKDDINVNELFNSIAKEIISRSPPPLKHHQNTVNNNNNQCSLS